MKVKKIDILIEDHEEFWKNTRKIAKEIDKGNPPKNLISTVSFHSFRELKKILTENRLKILQTVKQHKPDSIYKLAKILKREPENVLRDVNLLKDLGFVELEKKKISRVKVKPTVNYKRIEIGIQI